MGYTTTEKFVTSVRIEKATFLTNQNIHIIGKYYKRTEKKKVNNAEL